jgi:hypothetical protein
MDIKSFDPNDALKAVKERIKDSFVSLIPDDQWEDMIKKEITGYFAETPNNHQYGYNTQASSTSSFRKDVHALVSEETKTRTKAYLTENFQQVWDSNGQPRCNLAVEDIITKNAGKILSDMIGNSIQIAIQSAGYRI